MTTPVRQVSPQTYARVGGILYLYIIVAAMFAEMFVRGRLIVRGDAAATAAHIVGSETLFRAGLAAELLTCVCDVALAMILYVLLKPVSRSLALLAAFQRITFVAVYTVAKLFEVAALAVLGGSLYVKAFDPQQANALAYLFLRLHGEGYGISLIFFGAACIVLGYLIWKSGYLPRLIGALMVVGGVGYLIDSFAEILSPAFAAHLFPWMLLPAFFAELGLCLWLLVKGVDVVRWEERVA